MMGLLPGDLPGVFDGLDGAARAFGANCGVGASDILVSLLAMTEHAPEHRVIVKGNCGIPHFRGAEIHYSGTPELMAHYVRLAVDGGARIVGGCCGTTPEHLAAMREALDQRAPGERPTVESIVAGVGPLANMTPSAAGGPTRERRRAR